MPPPLLFSLLVKYEEGTKKRAQRGSPQKPDTPVPYSVRSAHGEELQVGNRRLGRAPPHQAVPWHCTEPSDRRFISAGTFLTTQGVGAEMVKGIHPPQTKLPSVIAQSSQNGLFWVISFFKAISHNSGGEKAARNGPKGHRAGKTPGLAQLCVPLKPLRGHQRNPSPLPTPP